MYILCILLNYKSIYIITLEKWTHEPAFYIVKYTAMPLCLGIFPYAFFSQTYGIAAVDLAFYVLSDSNGVGKISLFQ